MTGATTLLAGAAAGLMGPAAPDLEISAQVQARKVEIEQQGRSEARVHLDPEGTERIEVERNLPQGRSTYRDLTLDLNVEARIADPIHGRQSAAAASERTAPQTGEQ